MHFKGKVGSPEIIVNQIVGWGFVLFFDLTKSIRFLETSTPVTWYPFSHRKIKFSP